MSGPVILLRLSWPRRELWQNRRVHWAQRAKAVKAARHEAWSEARRHNVARLETDRPRLVFAFHPPDARHRDMQNMPATQKAAIDGIAQAMGCDDAKFRCVWPEAFAEPVKGGAVLVEVSAPDDWQHIADVAQRMVKGSVQ
jgi:crossover junction endodeoxyribonuclease RusA